MAAEPAVRTRTIESGVIEAYAALRASEREIAATRAAQPLANELVRATETAYGLGRGTQAAVVRASLAETELTERLVMLQTDVDMRRVELNAAMGRDPSTPIGALDDTAPSPLVPPLQVLLDRAGETHPE